MERGGQDTGDEKPRMTRKGAKSRKCRNDERETKHIWATTETRKRQSRRREGNRKERGMKGEDVRRDRGSQEEGTRGIQTL